MNKYYRLLDKILASGKTQTGRKGTSRYLLNESLSLTPSDLLDIFEGHNIARRKLRDELRLFMNGERSVEKYREAGISWWDYCGHTLVNSYPTYFEKLPPLIDRINREKRSSKNYVLFLGTRRSPETFGSAYSTAFSGRSAKTDMSISSRSLPRLCFR